MAASRSHMGFCLLVFCANLILIPTGHCHKNRHVALFIFGDSSYDSGNNNYINNAVKANVWPYGETFFTRPTGRFTDGRIIPDFIAEYANLPLIPPYLKLNGGNLGLGKASDHSAKNGVNFASAGAGALSETHRGRVIDLKTQLEYFKDVEKQLRLELGDADAKKLLSAAVYIFSVGDNDYFAAMFENTTLLQRYSREEYVGMVIGNLTTLVQAIHKRGGRKFGFLAMYPLGCLPFMRAFKEVNTGESGCLEEATLFAELHNTALSKALEELEGSLAGFKYSIFYAYKAGIERINNPLKHGFKETKEGCCGSGPYRATFNCGQIGQYQLCDNVDEYFFFDGGHLTDSANYQFAELMWSGSPDIVNPHNLKTLFEDGQKTEV